MGFYRSVILCVFVLIFISNCDGRVHRAERHSDSAEEDGGTGQSQRTPNLSSVPRSQRIVDIRMPGVRTTKEDEYLCYAWQVPEGEQYIVNFQALADASSVHHILLFGCEDAVLGRYWTGCAPCQNGGETILYAWAQNAPPLQLPKDVGFRIGTGSKVKYITMQVHYRNPTKANEPNDSSGVELTITTQRQQYIGGIYLMLVNDLRIPAYAPVIHGDAACMYNSDNVLHPFAFRTHAHALGRVISGYHVNDTWHILAKGNPHWPQAFYPVTGNVTVKKGDKLVSRCTYDATNKSVDTYIGSTHNDEMCNLYIMYYTINGGESYFICNGAVEPNLIDKIPSDSDVPLPPNPLLDATATGHKFDGIQVVTGWPHAALSDEVNLGQISGIATDSSGNVHIFHRGTHVWDYSAFENGNTYLKVSEGPIADYALLELDPESGEILKRWGANIFYLSHGLTIDHQNNFWVTDVALHQVMKFRFGSDKPDLTLGVQFEPGSDNRHFCKPTDVAVLSNGEFFVSDGYCNSRIMKFSSEGNFLMQWGESSASYSVKPPGGSFLIPHSISVDESRSRLYVADRENGRMQLFDFSGKLLSVWNKDEFTPKLFAVSYHQASDRLYAVNGGDELTKPVAIFGSTWNPDDESLISRWQPKSTAFASPHDVAVCPSGRNIYVAEIGPNRVWKFRNYDVVEGVPVSRRVEYTTVTHQSVKKSGVDVANDHAHDAVNASHRTGKFDVTALSLALAALFAVPLAVAVVVILCIRQCKPKLIGYNQLNSDGIYRTRKMQLRNVKPLISSANEYKDNPESDESEEEEFSGLQFVNQKAKSRSEGAPTTLTA